MTLAKMLFVICLLICASLAQPNLIPISSKTSWDIVVKTNPGFVLVQFSTPWCPLCNEFEGEYESIATKFKGNVAVVKHNCDMESSVCNEFHVSAFPTFKILKNGQSVAEFKEELSEAALLSWTKRAIGENAETLKDEQAVASFLSTHANSTSALIIGHFSSNKTLLYEQFHTASTTLKDFLFAKLFFNASSPQSQDEKVMMHKLHFGEPNVVFYANNSNLVDFIADNGHPLVAEVTLRTFERYKAQKALLLMVFLEERSETRVQNIRTLLNELAAQFRPRVHFGFSTDPAQFEPLVGVLNKWPTVFVISEAHKKKYRYQGKFNTQDVSLWLRKILQVEELHGNDEELADVSSGQQKNVKIVKTKSFDKLVLDVQKDVLVHFYEPWNSKSKKFLPKLEQLAVLLKPMKNILIAKMDVANNDVPIPVSQYPSTMFFLQNAKEDPLLYEGSLSGTKQLKKFIQDFASNSNRKKIKQLFAQEEFQKERKSPKKQQHNKVHKKNNLENQKIEKTRRIVRDEL